MTNNLKKGLQVYIPRVTALTMRAILVSKEVVTKAYISHNRYPMYLQTEIVMELAYDCLS